MTPLPSLKPEGLTRSRLRTMRDRWQRDYDTLLSASGDWTVYAEHDGSPYVETMRNLSTAIAWVDGMITARRKGDRP